MSHRSHSAEAESNVGSRMEPEYELTDDQWGLISDLFDDPPSSPLGGRPRASSRACFEAIAWILRTALDGVICLTIFHRTQPAGVD